MKKILVAEDDKFLHTAYEFKLTKAGFEVKLANDGNEVLEIVKTYIPDLIILDIMMPGMDGLTTLAEIKKNPQLATIPVIVASNLGQKDELEKAKALGARDFIVKSDMSLDNLIQKINALIGQ